MKRLLLISAIAMSGMFYNTANAQIRLHLGFHFGPRRVFVPARVVVTPPAPVVYDQPAPVAYNEQVAYNNNDDYYYLPDVDAYYNVNEQCYYYNDGGAWVSAASLPGAYRDFDWRSARRFEIRAPRPYMHADFYRSRYNGMAVNGRWNDRAYDRGNVNAYRDDRRVEDHRFDDRRSDRNNSHGREEFSRDNRHGRS